MIKRFISIYSFLFILTIQCAFAQSLDIGKLKINGKIGYYLSIESLKSYNIEIDSITPIPILMDISTADSLIYFGKSYFEYFKDSDYCHLGVIIFDEKITNIEIGEITLNQNTTIESIQKMFPLACKELQKIAIHEDISEYKCCSIPLEIDGQYQDLYLLLFFTKNKLKRIHLFEPS